MQVSTGRRRGASVPDACNTIFSETATRVPLATGHPLGLHSELLSSCVINCVLLALAVAVDQASPDLMKASFAARAFSCALPPEDDEVKTS